MEEREVDRHKESRPDHQKLPDNWDREGLSKGKQTGPVRPTPDAYNERSRGR